MRLGYRILPAVLGLAVLVCGLVTLREASFPRATADEKDPKAWGLPPLKVDKDAPLLDEPTKKDKERTSKPRADNGACHVCHTNYQEEPLAVTHARANVGCVKCHGQSIAHRNDEANVTPPETMYPVAKIDAACRKCHEAHDVPAAKVIARWQAKCPSKTNAKEIVCTDCHGEHRLKLRTVRWNKETGKLLSRESEGGKKAAP